MERTRLRDLGFRIGNLETGRYNAITDVVGVKVGHVTISRDQPQILRTGVTVILPHAGNITDQNCFGGSHVLNGNGEVTGLSFLNDFGRIHSPIALTGTYSVGAVHEGLVKAEILSGASADFKLPIVAETHDGWLSTGKALAVRPEHVLEALTNCKSGPVEEGNVGGGTGMICHEFKGGIGTSSRLSIVSEKTFCIGVIVQANHGSRQRLKLEGIPVGRLLPSDEIPTCRKRNKGSGSIIIVIATDAPLLPHQLKSLAQRAGIGLGRVGGLGETSSGDIFLAFSTANILPAWGQGSFNDVRMMQEDLTTPLYDAVVEATEEAIWNALCMAETQHGQQGRICHSIPLNRLQDIIKNYGSANFDI
jgi:D-aminopeptidase